MARVEAAAVSVGRHSAGADAGREAQDRVPAREPAFPVGGLLRVFAAVDGGSRDALGGPLGQPRLEERAPGREAGDVGPGGVVVRFCSVLRRG